MLHGVKKISTVLWEHLWSIDIWIQIISVIVRCAATRFLRDGHVSTVDETIILINNIFQDLDGCRNVTLNESWGNESDAVDKIILTETVLEPERERQNWEQLKKSCVICLLLLVFVRSFHYAHEFNACRVGRIVLRPIHIYNTETLEMISIKCNNGVVSKTLLKEFNVGSYRLLALY